MRKSVLSLLLLAGLIQLFSCKKDAKQPANTPKQPSLEQGIVSFSINGQLINATIDTTLNTITAVVPHTMDQHKITITFTLANQVNATINNEAISSGTVVDCSNPVVLKVTSADQKRSTSFKVNVETDLQYFGVMGNIISQNSLDKDYPFYFDQFDGSQFELINCGPTSSSMAIKWADSTFTGTPAYARSQIRPEGGWWTTSDVIAYLQKYGLTYTTDTLADVASVVKNSIDHNNVLILCLDMYSVTYNGLNYQHVNKFYPTDAPGWGHFIMIKGYIQTDSNFYLDAYDPYSGGIDYNIITVGQLKGKDRYYTSNDIQRATVIWWPYYIVVAPKGVYSISSRLSTFSMHKPIPVAKGR